MIVTLGVKKVSTMNNIIVGDADSLIALAYKDDANHERARKISRDLLDKGYQVIYPNTAILEAITALKRALNLPDKAHLINRQYQAGAFLVEYIDEEIQQEASKIFEEKAISKKNTIFDATIAATAEKLDAAGIFSFDSWYLKLGFKLAGEDR